VRDLSLYKIYDPEDGDTYVAAESYEAALKVYMDDLEGRCQPVSISWVDGDLLIQPEASEQPETPKPIQGVCGYCQAETDDLLNHIKWVHPEVMPPGTA